MAENNHLPAQHAQVGARVVIPAQVAEDPNKVKGTYARAAEGLPVGRAAHVQPVANRIST